MEKSKFVEDQPQPQSNEPQPTAATQIMQDSVNKLALVVQRKLQMAGGQIDILAIDIKVHILAEMMQQFAALIVELSNGKWTDDSITLTAAARVDALTQQIDNSLKAPMLARGVKQAMAGGKKGN